jgi:hypothetical protein
MGLREGGVGGLRIFFSPRPERFRSLPLLVEAGFRTKTVFSSDRNPRRQSPVKLTLWISLFVEVSEQMGQNIPSCTSTITTASAWIASSSATDTPSTACWTCSKTFTVTWLGREHIQLRTTWSSVFAFSIFSSFWSSFCHMKVVISVVFSNKNRSSFFLKNGLELNSTWVAKGTRSLIERLSHAWQMLF